MAFSPKLAAWEQQMEDPFTHSLTVMAAMQPVSSPVMHVQVLLPLQPQVKSQAPLAGPH